MRAIRTLIIGAVLFLVCTAARSKFNKDEGNMSKNFAVNTYINAVKHGKSAGLETVLATNADLTLTNGGKASDFSKGEAPDYLKENGKPPKKCVTNARVIENNANAGVVRVDMQYNKLTHSSYLTLANTGTGWEITKVSTTVK